VGIRLGTAVGSVVRGLGFGGGGVEGGVWKRAEFTEARSSGPAMSW